MKAFRGAVYDFMVEIANNEIISGKKYVERIEISDGGVNSYIGLCVDVEDFRRSKPVTRGLRLFRNTNSADGIINTWGFELGGICNPYADHPDIPMKFTSYGKTANEAESEALKHFDKMRALVRKSTSNYKAQAKRSAQEEKEQLLARLSELEDI